MFSLQNLPNKSSSFYSNGAPTTTTTTTIVPKSNEVQQLLIHFIMVVIKLKCENSFNSFAEEMNERGETSKEQYENLVRQFAALTNHSPFPLQGTFRSVTALLFLSTLLFQMTIDQEQNTPQFRKKINDLFENEETYKNLTQEQKGLLHFQDEENNKDVCHRHLKLLQQLLLQEL